MRRVLVFLLLLPFFGYVMGQEFKLISLEETPTDSSKTAELRHDLNGDVSALVVLSFHEPIQNLTFKGNVIEAVAIDERTYELYVANKTKRITIQHENYYPFVLDFKDKGVNIVGGHSYLVVIDNEHQDEVTYEAEPVGSQYLVFKSKTGLKRLTVDGEEWCVEDKYEFFVASRLVTFGVHTYEAESADGKVVKGEVNVKSKLSSKVLKLTF